MITKKFSDALGNVGENYVNEAATYVTDKKIKHWLKWAIAACLCLIVAGGAGLVFTDRIVSVPVNSDYILICDGDKSFLVFDNIIEYEIKNPTSQIISGLYFDTMEEFKNTVTNGLLTDSQKRHMVLAFSKDSTGAIKICDFNNLYVPQLPANSSVSEVYWEGETYSFFLTLNDGVSGSLGYLTEEIYNYIYLDYLNFFDRDLITVTKIETLENGRVVTYYNTRGGEFMNVRYTLTDGDKTIVVEKEFTLSLYDNSHGFHVSSSVPDSVNLYGSYDDEFFHVLLRDFTTDPTDEWILSFGLEKY